MPARDKFGGLDRDRGVGVEGPFFSLKVACIPNLSLLQSLELFEKKSKI